ncbi:calcium-binding protein CML27 [Acrasis kona]|uniref:Calcium-binding protein CML27 n=1 Tax=Acrasis kona TaxID=1008807 RepID=A0AAW2ZIM1_9EUKA
MFEDEPTFRRAFYKHVGHENVTNRALRSILLEQNIPHDVLNNETIEALMLTIDRDEDGRIGFSDFLKWYKEFYEGGGSDLDVHLLNIGELLTEVKERSKCEHGTITTDKFKNMWLDAGNRDDGFSIVASSLDPNQTGAVSFKHLAFAFGFINEGIFDKRYMQMYYTPVDYFRRMQFKQKYEKDNATKKQGIKLKEILRRVKADNSHTQSAIVKNQHLTKYRSAEDLSTLVAPSVKRTNSYSEKLIKISEDKSLKLKFSKQV